MLTVHEIAYSLDRQVRLVKIDQIYIVEHKLKRHWLRRAVSLVEAEAIRVFCASPTRSKRK